MAGNDVLGGVGPLGPDDYRKFNVDNRQDPTAGPKGEGGDIVTSRLPCGADYFSVSYPTASQEVYTFKKGGSGGTTVGTLTLNYTSGAKTDLANGTWS